MEIFVRLEGDSPTLFTAPLECNGFITKELKKDILQELNLDHLNINDVVILPDDLLIYHQVYTIKFSLIEYKTNLNHKRLLERARAM